MFSGALHKLACWLFSDTVLMTSFRLCVVVVSFELYPFLPGLLTLFQRDVCRTKSVETMSFVLVAFNFGSAICWVCYGTLLEDSFVAVSSLLCFIGMHFCTSVVRVEVGVYMLKFQGCICLNRFLPLSIGPVCPSHLFFSR